MGNAASGDKGRHRHGYHVLRVKDNSPASLAGLQPFFDYIMAANGIRLNTESTILNEQIEACEDKAMVLDVYSTRTQALRKVEMMPTKKWGDGTEGLIGCSIRFCLFDTINDIVWHILDISPESPAERAGLLAHTDYVIGTPLGVMRGEGDLYDLVEDYVGEPMALHVYNVEANNVREVVIVPSDEWGGEGLLGCDVGYGYLHRLPKDLTRYPGSKERIFEENQEREEQESKALMETTAITSPINQTPETLLPPPLPEKQEHGNSASGTNATFTLPDYTVEKAPIETAQLSRYGAQDPSRPLNDLTDAAQRTPHSSSEIAPTVKLLVDPVPKDVEKLGSPIHIPDSIPQAHDESVKIVAQTPETHVQPTQHLPPLEMGEHSASDQKEGLEVIMAEASTYEHQPALTPGMRPGIHVEVAEVGHDGYPTCGNIPLQDAQGQSSEQSSQDSTSQEKQENEDTRNQRQEPQNGNREVPEYVLEGMIRNMALGASVFPL
ncbi:Golgi reassembly-stacking protein 2 [Dissophora globulifera]|uniref:Golgi reassembly-stacking protein 2 n=1 Tax=Dissophora globulifera TaxID=979702 RepID=A0A9P6RQJ8_9FUNG|nr:Golgi reassembly-stacking protein 2 [Dissophora globulifera]